jgi:uncharacterized protein YgbK (DUF1537 family)
MTALLGAIADDVTGATDLAGILVKNGMPTVQMLGVPSGPWPTDAGAVVVALKSRTAPVADAVAESLAALAWLKAAGCRQFYFKYCSTFDSTPRGNIGPVADALLDALGAGFTVACPAFPATGRTIYQGTLFVGGLRLDESGMRHHPLTPMTDANLVRVLQAQTPGNVGLTEYADVARGADAIVERWTALRHEGIRFAVVDAIFDRDLQEIGRAAATLPFITGGSGLAQGLPENFRRGGLLASDIDARRLPATHGFRAVISGSCSSATQTQVRVMRESRPSFRVDPIALARGEDVVSAALAWAREQVSREPILIYATAAPDEVRHAQETAGAERAAELVERALAGVAAGLVSMGAGRMIVAGGETAGAVMRALGVTRLTIGREIDPGVPWTAADLPAPASRAIALALKSGNFGSPDFFLKAWNHLDATS